MRRDDHRLSDIVEALDWIAKAVPGRTEAGFAADERLCQGGCQAEVKARCGFVSWQDIVGLRNILVHEYFGIYWPLVWQTAVDHAPVMRTQIAAIGKE